MFLKDIVKEFKFEGTFINGFRYGSGHINDTYVLVFQIQQHSYRRYLLQRINHSIFKNIDGLMSNIEKVLNKSHESLLKEGKDPFKNSMTLVKTNNDKTYLNLNGNYYRSYFFIEEGIGFDLIDNPIHFYESGIAFGRFQNLLKTFDASELIDTIPNFHHTKNRYDLLLEAIELDSKERVCNVLDEIAFIKQRSHYYDLIINLLESGKMPYRVTHNDTKLNNVLISPLNNKALCVIDLDTIMKGSIVYDFGDSIRFGASEAKEDEIDLAKVKFNLGLFEHFTKGFLTETKTLLTDVEINHLAFGAILMTIETGIRFLTDYLNGDTYFRIHRDNHNLDRARTQLELVSQMEDNLSVMTDIVLKHSK